MSEQKDNKLKKNIDKVVMGAVIGGAIGSVVGGAIQKKRTDMQEEQPKKRGIFFRLLRLLFGKKK